MAAPEREMIGTTGNTSAEEASSAKGLIELLREHLEPFGNTVQHVQIGTLFLDIGAGLDLVSTGPHWAHSGQFVMAPSRVVTVTGSLQELNPTATVAEDPLLQAVSRASTEQREEIWRLLGVRQVEQARRVVNPNPQPVATDWLEDALEVRAKPTPASLEDWYDEDQT